MLQKIDMKSDRVQHLLSEDYSAVSIIAWRSLCFPKIKLTIPFRKKVSPDCYFLPISMD